jgi:uncharacterized membrane protein
MNGLAYVGLGAALMYLLDPQLGRKRRNDLRNQAEATRRKVQRGTDAVLRDATNRTHGMLVETRQWLQSQRQRIESRGQGAASGAQAAGSEVASAARTAVAPWRKSRWSPAQRALAGIAGAGLATSGYVRGGLAGLAMTVTGAGLIARAAANEELGALAKGRPFSVERTVRIDAPVAEVYGYWRDFGNFPRWMSHVREVRDLGGGRYHWVVDGPAGVPVEWDSELTQVREDRELAWRSVEGSTVDNGGRVRFEPDGDGTRVRVELTYAPPGGVIGHAVAKAFGVDPASEMDDDLGKLKARIEAAAGARNAGAARGDSGLGAAPA